MGVARLPTARTWAAACAAHRALFAACAALIWSFKDIILGGIVVVMMAAGA